MNQLFFAKPRLLNLDLLKIIALRSTDDIFNFITLNSSLLHAVEEDDYFWREYFNLTIGITIEEFIKPRDFIKLSVRPLDLIVLLKMCPNLNISDNVERCDTIEYILTYTKIFRKDQYEYLNTILNIDWDDIDTKQEYDKSFSGFFESLFLEKSHKENIYEIFGYWYHQINRSLTDDENKFLLILGNLDILSSLNSQDIKNLQQSDFIHHIILTSLKRYKSNNNITNMEDRIIHSFNRENYMINIDNTINVLDWAWKNNIITSSSILKLEQSFEDFYIDIKILKWFHQHDLSIEIKDNLFRPIDDMRWIIQYVNEYSTEIYFINDYKKLDSLLKNDLAIYEYLNQLIKEKIIPLPSNIPINSDEDFNHLDIILNVDGDFTDMNINPNMKYLLLQYFYTQHGLLPIKKIHKDTIFYNQDLLNFVRRHKLIQH